MTMNADKHYTCTGLLQNAQVQETDIGRDQLGLLLVGLSRQQAWLDCVGAKDVRDTAYMYMYIII